MTIQFNSLLAVIKMQAPDERVEIRFEKESWSMLVATQAFVHLHGHF